MPTQVFLSYAQVPEGHKQRVAELAAALRAAGLSVVFDHDVTSPQGPPEGWPKWMLDQIERADWVLVVCNETYYRRFRGREVPGIGLGATEPPCATRSRSPSSCLPLLRSTERCSRA